ncbi:Beta-N-acetylhexosaminidase [Penicillium ucsense]|uniref:Beta-N-acetylhexosaminidase n=1 Tax=Penicillium ucsense TaxID=2839758 RepID=A0A8J8WFQ4_9EURO|nr:Beta-N-acetylhexosaminidase [Penicillium ucsense]KAF7734964.1 Beta-N-acetylhexosaminidase [Penicillium ucsense]
MIPFSLPSIVHWPALVSFLLVVVTAKKTPANHVKKSFKITPTPQELSSHGQAISLTLDVIKAIVSLAGEKVDVSSSSTAKRTQIVVGTQSENQLAADIARSLTGKSAHDLRPDGYILKPPSCSMAWTSVVSGAHIRDWPLMSIRGSIEGFYGEPWSHQARLDQFVFYGKHEMNTYIYTPEDDPLLRAQWRTFYIGDALSQLHGLIDTANANHVDVTFASSPGLDLCYLPEADFEATIKKFDQACKLGVRRFYIAFDDIPTVFHCDSDKAKWPDEGDWHWLVDAQAYYLYRVQEKYIVPNSLNDLKTADSTYVTDKLFLWNNFPVNDGKRDRLFLNPLTGRAPDLYKYLLGFTSNPMEQAYASMPVLANYGDYMWNSPTYNADDSMAAVLRELAGADDKVHDALLAVVDLNQNWPYRSQEVHVPQLSQDIDEFWTQQQKSLASQNEHGKDINIKPCKLIGRLDLLITLSNTLSRTAIKDFADDVAPWSTAAMQWATSCQHLIAMLQALDQGDQATATTELQTARSWVEKTKAKSVND